MWFRLFLIFFYPFNTSSNIFYFIMAASLDLKPEKVQVYLKMITEAVLIDSQNNGTLRKNIWLYLMKNYQAEADYMDFLLAIRRFINEGKMTNKDGFFQMHP